MSTEVPQYFDRVSAVIVFLLVHLNGRKTHGGDRGVDDSSDIGIIIASENSQFFVEGRTRELTQWTSVMQSEHSRVRQIL
jgi:hypothetical protein